MCNFIVRKKTTVMPRRLDAEDESREVISYTLAVNVSAVFFLRPNN